MSEPTVPTPCTPWQFHAVLLHEMANDLIKRAIAEDPEGIGALVDDPALVRWHVGLDVSGRRAIVHLLRPAGNIIEAVEIGRVGLDPSNPDELGTWTSSWLPAVAPVDGADGRPH